MKTIIAVIALGITPLTPVHDRYTGWQRPDNGQSCCNMIDCKQVPWRLIGGKIELQIEGVWTVPPQSALLGLPSADETAHACYAYRWTLQGVMQPAVHCWQQPGGAM